MTPEIFVKLPPVQRVEWLDSVSPTGSWTIGDDVFCNHCDGVWKAEDVACDSDGDPTCPVCRSSTPLNFHYKPWWRYDLMEEAKDGPGHNWIGAPVQAIAGKPRSMIPVR